ncbi:hypothetical protein AOLI_G00118380 [Acnodon oligacanthus]
MCCNTSDGDSGDSGDGDSSDILVKTEDPANRPARWPIRRPCAAVYNRHPGSGCFQAFSLNRHRDVTDIPSHQSQVLKEHFRLLLDIVKKRTKARILMGEQKSRKSTVPQDVRLNCGPRHQHGSSEQGVENGKRCSPGLAVVGWRSGNRPCGRRFEPQSRQYETEVQDT